MDLGLDGKRVIVTASSKGLGRASAERFVDEGARVVINSRDEDNLAAAKEHILEGTGADADRVVPVAFDLADPDAVEAGMGEALDALGGLDVLVTNHIGPPALYLEEATLEDFDESYRKSLRCTIQIAKRALPVMVEDGGGAVTNIVSASAREPPEGHAVSNVFRPGTYGLSKSIANEYGDRGVRSNCICPRGVYTERIEYKMEVLTERDGITMEEARARRTEELAVDELGDTDDFGAAVAYLSSDLAGYVTGSFLTFDGGFSRGAF